MFMSWIIRLRLSHLLKSSLAANVLTLMTGTVIAQAITVSLSPVVTRLFSPSAFGVVGVYVAVLSIVSAFMTFRYDQALMLPKVDRDAAHLLWAALLCVATFSYVSLLICAQFQSQILILLK